ncbi:MAG: hypothetical protein P8Z79_01090 [Sedimentisphaerales bacterium]|jgi:hypothetical protein
MSDYDSNSIAPVQGLQTIPGLSSAGRRKEGKRRQQLRQEEDKSAEDKENRPQTPTEDQDGPAGGKIDYCA